VILVDSNVLIGLADPRDRLNTPAVADLKRLCGQELLLAAPVVAEVCFLLPTRTIAGVFAIWCTSCESDL
jgi:predicted nucleic acid-binding protein